MTRRIDRRELVRLLDVEEDFVIELERHEILRQDPRGGYDRACLERVRVCWSMHHSLGVNMEGLEVALDLLERWQAERREMHRLLRELRDRLESK